MSLPTFLVAEPPKEALASARLLALQEAWRRGMCRRPSRYSGDVASESYSQSLF